MSFLGKRIVINKKRQSLNNSISNLTPKKLAYSIKISDESGVQKLKTEMNLYRQRHDQDIVKIKFLIDKLVNVGASENIPEDILRQTSQIDKKIKKLQQLLFFKRSKQMQKLKQKVQKFLTNIQFDVEEQIVSQMEDEVELILFLMDVFTERYKEMIADKMELVEALQSESRIKLINEIKQTKFELQKITNYSKDLEIQLFKIRRQEHEAKQNGKNSLVQSFQIQNIRILEQQNNRLLHKNTELQKQITTVNMELSKIKRKINETELAASEWKNKYKKISQETDKNDRDNIRWKQRYTFMEQQKQQRIKLLEDELFFQDKKRNTNKYLVSNSSQEYFDL